MDKFILVVQQVHASYYIGAMDIFCLSSSNESFSNVLVEAMAMGLPYVATDVGIANVVLHGNGFVVPIQQPVVLAEALLTINMQVRCL